MWATYDHSQNWHKSSRKTNILKSVGQNWSISFTCGPNMPTAVVIRVKCAQLFAAVGDALRLLRRRGEGREHARGSQVREEHRRKGKGSRCCMGDGINSIPCRTRYFPPGWFLRKVPMWNGFFEKKIWSSASHRTEPSSYQNGCSPKNFCPYQPCC